MEGLAGAEMPSCPAVRYAGCLHTKTATVGTFVWCSLLRNVAQADIKHAIISCGENAGSGVGGWIRRPCSRCAASLVIPGDDTSLIDMTTV
jgi:hypothetical protein